MTPQQLQSRVEYWQRNLPQLGLAHWRIEVSVTDDNPRGLMDAKAAVTHSSHYDTAWLEYNREGLKNDTQQDVDEVIIHELLHLRFRELCKASMIGEDFLPPSVESARDDAFHHAEESLIEALARTIYHAYNR